jgi:branched-chain amino acid aminotransferase
MFVWLRGTLVPTEEAVVSISSETALRGANVFEGMRAYADGSATRSVVGLRAHLDRLMESARLLHLDHTFDHSSFRHAIHAVLEANDYPPDDDLYIRPAICVESGRLPSDPAYAAIDYVSISRCERSELFRLRKAIVSRHRRLAQSSVSACTKAGGAYLSFRLPLVERAQARADAVIVLNERDDVAEAEGAAVCVVRDGVICSPPVEDGCLDSITRRIVADIAAHIGVPYEERSIRRSELYAADAVFLAGTLCELVPIGRIDGLAIHPKRNHAEPVFERVAREFDRLRTGSGAGTGSVVDHWLEPLRPVGPVGPVESRRERERVQSGAAGTDG